MMVSSSEPTIDDVCSTGYKFAGMYRIAADNSSAQVRATAVRITPVQRRAAARATLALDREHALLHAVAGVAGDQARLA